MQGISIRPLIEFINVRRTNRNLDTINVEIHCRVCHKRRCAVEKNERLCFCAVLICLPLLSAHGAHHSWHRGPVWTVEPPLLEGQVRQRFSEPGPSFCVVLLDNAIVLCVCVGVLTAGQTRVLFSFLEEQLVLHNSLKLLFFTCVWFCFCILQ